MHATAFLLVASLAAQLPDSAEGLNGNWTCRASGSWGCGRGPGAICVDSSAPRRGAARLDVNFDTRRVRLQGLAGHLEPNYGGPGYVVRWHVAGLGHSTLTSGGEDFSPVVNLTYASPDGGRSIGVFRCRQSLEARP